MQPRVYQHTFENGEKITIAADFSGPKLVLKFLGNELSQENFSEYEIWRNAVIVPDITNSLNLEQLENVIDGALKEI